MRGWPEFLFVKNILLISMRVGSQEIPFSGFVFSFGGCGQSMPPILNDRRNRNAKSCVVMPLLRQRQTYMQRVSGIRVSRLPAS
jgi:hypothetical protein